jgi:DNA-binding transcriptional regulator YdaS (Cro superfamily)
MWRLRKSVPPDQVVPMEQVVGGFVTRYQLRPKTFGAAPVPDQSASGGYLPAGIRPSEAQ